MKFFLAALIALSFTVPAYAEEKKEEAKTEKAAPAAKEESKPAEKTAPADKNNPLQKWVGAENAMIDKLSDKDKESIFILRNKYSIIRVIGIVERDIKAAVKSCGDNNPDIKDQMNARFQQWQGAVNPIVATAKKQLDKDIDAQTIVPTKEFKRVLKLNDEAYEYGEKQIMKNPVSTKEACADLVKSMDRTESEMITLLQETLLPESVIRSRAEKAKAEEEKKKSFSKNKAQ